MLTLNPDPHLEWIYDPSHKDYNSPMAKDLRDKRARTIHNAPEWMKRDAELNTLLLDDLKKR